MCIEANICPGGAPARTPQQKPRAPRQKPSLWIVSTHGWQDVPVYDREDLRPGCKLHGPLLIEERTTTAFVGAGDAVEVNAADDFLVHIGAAA